MSASLATNGHGNQHYNHKTTNTQPLLQDVMRDSNSSASLSQFEIDQAIAPRRCLNPYTEDEGPGTQIGATTDNHKCQCSVTFGHTAQLRHNCIAKSQ